MIRFSTIVGCSILRTEGRVLNEGRSLLLDINLNVCKTKYEFFFVEIVPLEMEMTARTHRRVVWNCFEIKINGLSIIKKMVRTLL